MLFTNTQNKVLTADGNLTSSINKALLIKEKIVSSNISRFKVGDKYIGCVFGDAYLTDKSDDSTLFLVKSQRYITIGGFVLSLEEKNGKDRENEKEKKNGKNSLCAIDRESETSLKIIYLSQREIYFHKFLRDGFITWEREREKEKEYNNDIDEIKNKILKYKHVTRISNLFSLDSRMVDFFKEPTLRYLLDRIYINYHLTTFSSNTLRNTDNDERFFHVDYPYHNLTAPYPDEILGIQVICALDDFTIENGATMYLPGSHKMHEFPTNEKIQIESIKHITVPKGHIIFFRGDIWHSQGRNITDSPRVALLANFSPLNIPAKDTIVEYVTSTNTNLRIEDGKVLI